MLNFIIVPIFSAVFYFFAKWVYKNRLGLISKISAIGGFQLEFLEKQRWQFFQFNREKKSEKLIVSFAGAALRVGGTPIAEFKKTLHEMECDQLFLIDPNQSWYLNDPKLQWNGYEYHSEKLKNFIKESNYKKVMFIGASLGATAALLYSNMSDLVLAFNPQVDINRLRGMMGWNARRVPKHIRINFCNLLNNNISKCNGKIFAHISTLPGDALQATYLKPVDHLTIVKHLDFDEHGLASHLKKKGQLVSLIKDAYDKYLN